MNENVDKLKAMLERATGPGDASAEELDPQAARLRETWLVFGQLLDAAQPATDISTLVSGEDARSVPARVRPHRWRLVASAGLAVSLFIAVAVVWMLGGAGQEEQFATDTQQNAAPVATPANVIMWDDALDEQIARLGRQMDGAHADQLGTVDEFTAVQSRIEQFSQEVTADSL